MSAITTHILDVSRGRPAGGVEVVLHRQGDSGWQELARGVTDDDGRVSDLLGTTAMPGAGIYRLRFEIGPYFARLGVPTFYPWAEIAFRIEAPEEHYHVPLLLSPFGYSTYRGS